MRHAALPVRFTLLLCIALPLACSKSPSADDEAPATTFPMTSTNVVVKESSLPKASSTRMVRADFNQDRLEDVAVAEQDEEGREVVTVYLRKRTADIEAQFVKAGGILQPGSYTISALMSAAHDDATDLVAIFAFTDGRKELVQFRSKADAFVEVERKTLSQGGGTAP